MRMMRSWMFVPGHQRRMIDKAYGLNLDVVMFDLEDGVPPGEKDTARAMMAETLSHPPSKMLPFCAYPPRWNQRYGGGPACGDSGPGWMGSR